MKSFFRMIFASAIGTGLVLGLIFFVFIGSIVGAVGMSQQSEWKKPKKGGQKDILTVSFNGPIVEKSRKVDVVEALLGYNETPTTGLYELTETLAAAAKDENIKGLYLDLKNVAAGWAHLETLRREIAKFKDAGKFVVAFGETYSERSYYLASIADEIILYPRGFFEWDGMYVSGVYFKNAMDRWDVKPQIFRVGKYKSAIEPFITDQMSEASREQLTAILGSTWETLSQAVAEARQVRPEDLDTWADEASIIYAQDAFEKKLVDLLGSYEEVETRLMDLTKAKEEPGYYEWQTYHKEKVENFGATFDDKVAVIFADGEIVSGRGDRERIGSSQYAGIMRDIAKDENIKAVVLRINSPGGSALASDVMWTSSQFLKDKKPIVASFGNVAASGGYYMSAGANYIMAEETTVTGSIGVFGLNFQTDQFFKTHVGLTFDTQKTHTMADSDSTNRALTPEERIKMQGVVDRIYQDFLNVVTQGRPELASVEESHEVAQGRVWIGSDAKKNGLVDDFGGLNEAIGKSAKLANLKDYQVVTYPKAKSQVEEFMGQFAEASTKVLTHWIPESLKSLYKNAVDAKLGPKELSEKIYTRMPYDIKVR